MPVNDSSTNVGTAGVTLHTTGAHLLQLGSGALAQCVQAVASESELTRKSPV